MMPFDLYPQRGNEPLGIPDIGDNTSRKSYGPPTFNICGYYCAYCGADLHKDYQSWLSITVDHVVPKSTPWADQHDDWIEDLFNRVTCCGACNGFLNRFDCQDQPPNTTAQFIEIRDRIFRVKCERVRERHHEERMWFERNVAHHM